MTDQKATYRWIITHDHVADPTEPIGTNLNSLGLDGPYDCDSALKTNPLHFRLYDDDGDLYYEGILYGDYTGFEPLDDFGLPNAGCTSVFVKEKGLWNQL